MEKVKGEGGEGESVVRNTDEAIIYTLLSRTLCGVEWGKVKGREERGRAQVW